ncbi:AsmA-like C-terminal region-containing protein [Sediminibacterium sp.]|uniref:AsmA family protein n=1 Tax=Sediminibacterium sp. TaxID=1917865 RepID=UPI002733D07C|nr:AsmA-like C-terminal region-containing protein [Sediminibacterium sp.]MDP3567589.1 AsmA-like C-terminal region-containing protein [Sediminibacterium sp.]
MENNTEITPKKKSFFKRLVKTILYLSATVFIICVVLVSLLFIYQEEVKQVLLGEINKHLKAEVKIDPKNIDLTIFKTFPDCSLEFKEVLMLEALKIKKRDTLLFAEKLNLHFNISDLWNKKYNIKKIKLTNSVVKPCITNTGEPNYIFWEETKKENKNDSINFNLKLIEIENCHLIYRDKVKIFKTDLLIQSLKFKGNFSDNEYDLNSKGKIVINLVKTKQKTFLKNKNCNLKIDLKVNGDNYLLQNTSVSINNMKFNLDGDFNYKDSLKKVDLNYAASDLDIETLLSLLPEDQKQKANDYKSSGVFYANGSFKYSNGKDFNLKSEFGIKNAEIIYKPTSTTAKNVNVNGNLVYSNTMSKLDLTNIFLQLNNDELKGSFSITNFANPFIRFSVDANANLENLQNFWPIDTLAKLQGSLKINSEVEGLLSDLKEQTFSTKVKVNIEATISNLEAQFKGDENIFAIENCSVTAKDREVEVKNLKLKRGNSDVVLNGKLPGIFNYLSDKTAPLIITGNLFSNYIKLEDFMMKYENSKDNSAPLIPKNIQFKLNAAILKFSYSKFEAQAITGEIEIKNQKAIVSDMKLQTMQGEAEIDAYADNSNNALDIVMQAKLKNINLRDLFFQFNNFGQTTLQEKNVKGFATAELGFSGNWSNSLEPNLNSIKSTINLTIDKGELVDFKPLLSLAKFVDVQELQKIKFSNLKSNIEIKDKTIFLPTTSIKNSALNIIFWGTHSFNNDINYHIELLISELLSKKRKNKDEEFGPVEKDPDNKRSAFILMTGTVDNPIIKYDRKGLKENIKQDLKDEKQNLKQLLKTEFGLFKKDSLPVKQREKADQKFELENPDNNKPKKTLEAKKKKEDDDDF